MARWGRNGGRMDRPCGACLDTRYRPRGARVPKGQDPWARGSRRNGAQNEDTLWRESRTRRRPLSGGRGGPISHQADRERSCRAEVSAKWGVENQGGRRGDITIVMLPRQGALVRERRRGGVLSAPPQMRPPLPPLRPVRGAAEGRRRIRRRRPCRGMRDSGTRPRRRAPGRRRGPIRLRHLDRSCGHQGGTLA